jgi:hypothetical protein
LMPLPTRDAVLPLLATLHSSAEKSISVRDLFESLPARHGKAGLLDNVPQESSRAIVRGLSPSSLLEQEAGLQEVELEEGSVVAVVRDGHPADLTPELRAEMSSIARRIRRHFTPERGFGDIMRINYIDGVRIFFEGGDVAHVRPSGNAPQLRIYAATGSQSRSDEIVRMGIREPDGILRGLEAELAARPPHPPSGPRGGRPPSSDGGTETDRVLRVRQNIALTSDLIERGETPEVIGCVSGSESARKFWQRILDRARVDLKAQAASSLHEDLPTNQAFGTLLLWQRLKPQLEGDRGALVAFVFGEGTRSSPLTETDSAQKPAIATPVRVASDAGSRFLSMVELALRHFVPVQQHLRRSGFNGLVIKWGDEVQIPSVDLSGRDPRFQDADVVRFVSARAMNEDDAANKDWVGLDEEGMVTAFIPRRKLSEMEKLADRGLIRRKAGRLHGGVNLGSIAVSAALLDALLDEFRSEVNDPAADRSRRPDLDPQFFTALTVAAIEDPARRAEEWARALEESKAIRKMEADMPGILDRLRRTVERLEESQGRRMRMVAMDCGEPYWGDIGQHPKMYEFYMALREEGPAGEISRALAGLDGAPADERGNRMAGDCRVGSAVKVERSVLIDATLSGKGSVKDSVLIGTRAANIRAEGAFDVLSTVRDLTLKPRAGTYKVVSRDPVRAAAGERLTTLFLPGRSPCLFKVGEETPLQDKAATYDVPILGNPMSFREAHAQMGKVSVEDLDAARRRAEQEVLGP